MSYAYSKVGISTPDMKGPAATVLVLPVSSTTPNSSADVVTKLVKTVSDAVIAKLSDGKAVGIRADALEMLNAYYIAEELLGINGVLIKGGLARLNYSIGTMNTVFPLHAPLFAARSPITATSCTSGKQYLELFLEYVIDAPAAQHLVRQKLTGFKWETSGMPVALWLKRLTEMMSIGSTTLSEIWTLVGGLLPPAEASEFRTWAASAEGKALWQLVLNRTNGTLDYQALFTGLDTKFNAMMQFGSFVLKPVPPTTPATVPILGIDGEARMFKGKCHGCHQVGHKKVDCPNATGRGAPPANPRGGRGSLPSVDRSKLRCDHCNITGSHDTVDCRKRRNQDRRGGGRDDDEDTRKSKKGKWGAEEVFRVNPRILQLRQDQVAAAKLEQAEALLGSFHIKG